MALPSRKVRPLSQLEFQVLLRPSVAAGILAATPSSRCAWYGPVPVSLSVTEKFNIRAAINASEVVHCATLGDIHLHHYSNESPRGKS